MPDSLPIEAYFPAAQAALAAFDLADAALNPIGKSENVVFRAEARDSTCYAVRLHRPGYLALAELESERLLTAHLAELGMIVPTGRQTTRGGWYAEVQTPDPQGTRLAGVTLWHPGQTLSDLIGDDHSAESRGWFERTGALLADLHTNTANWTPPARFIRHRLDADGLVGEAPFWGRFWEAQGLPPDEHHLLTSARELVAACLAEVSTPLVPIHADAHPGNVLVSGDKLGLIDFDDCAWGWPVFDMAVSLRGAWAEPDFHGLRDRFLAGYQARRALPDDILQQLDLFLLARSLMLVSWCADRPEVVGDGPDADWKRELLDDVRRGLEVLS